jgi:hypothetical protein
MEWGRLVLSALRGGCKGLKGKLNGDHICIFSRGLINTGLMLSYMASIIGEMEKGLFGYFVSLIICFFYVSD